MTVSKKDLRNETRNWLARGVVPSAAAASRRAMAERTPLIAEIHLAYAAEWDRIAATQQPKVIAALEAKRDYHLNCISNILANNPEPSDWCIKHHENEAARWDAEILAIDPDYEPSR